MNQQSLTFAGFVLAAFVFAACGDDPKTSGGSVEDQEVIAISDKTISGVSQKGPFVNGSSVTVQELDGETLAQTGDSYEGKIKNDLGEFSVKVTKLASQYALLKANGFYRNEVTGEKSKSQVTLYALTDLSDRDEVNVNLLTHLAYERSLYLATGKDSLSVSRAKKQAEAEVLKTFGIEGDFAAAEDLNIFGDNDQSAALLAVSVLMQGNLSEGDFSERLANYAADIESDGIWNDSKTATKIADWANSQGLGSGLVKIRENITKWELSADVPAFEKYVNNFWWQNYGLGTCDKKRESEVLKNQNTASANADEYYICKSNSWQVASDLEKDTYKWATGKDAEVKYGDVVKENCYVFEDKTWRAGNKLDCSLELQGCTKLRQDTVGKGSDKVWHICDDKSWRDATTFEKDTFGWKNSTDGVIKKGNVTDTIYVFDKTKWRVTSNVEAKLGGCVSAIADSVGKVESIYYICKSGKWVDASALEYDTYKWTAGKDGDSKLGSVNTKNCYVYEDNSWRSGNANDCTLDLRGCSKLRQDTVGKGSDNVWHICDAMSWRNATTYEKDTFGWKDSTDGAIKKGNVTDTIYVFDKTVWRVTSNVEAKLGGCVAAIADSVGKVGSTYYICKSNKWVEASAIEYDTYRWAAGKDGDSKAGSVNASNCYVFEDKAWRSGNSNDCSLGLRGCTTLRQDTVGKGSDNVWHICDTKSWRNATTYEKDTFGWIAGVDGEIKKGNVTDTIYVFDKTVWRVTSKIEAKLGGCVAAIADSVGKVGETYYICKSNKWVEASAIEYDTYRWGAGKDGDNKVGSVNADNCYVFENSVWRSGNKSDCSLGLRGCTALRQDTVGLGSDNIWHICDTKSWRNATNIEKDTATWGAGTFDGEVRVGQVNTTVYYIYWTLNHAWRNATTLEKDTYDYTNNMDWLAGTDGEIKKGSVTDSVYVYDASTWRTADEVEKILGGCVTAIADSVGKVGSTYYICTPRKWVVATILQYDTYKKECLTDGSIVDGNVISSNKYVCDDGVFRVSSENDLRAELGCTSYTRGEYRILRGQYSYYKCETDGWLFTTEKLNQGTMTDERDGNEYKVIGIGNQMWLAENLKFYVEQGVCKESSADSCAKYGIFYKWTTLMDIDDIYDDEYAVGNLVYPHKGICPDGWHIPQRKEWQTLENFVASHIADNSEENLPKHLIADDWIVSDDKKTKKGLNTFGLGILPYDGGSYAWYHSADEHMSYGHGTIVFGFDISYYSYSSSGFLGKGSFFPVRCVKD